MVFLTSPAIDRGDPRNTPLTDSNRFNGFAWMETVKTVRKIALVARPPRSIAGLMRMNESVMRTRRARFERERTHSNYPRMGERR